MPIVTIKLLEGRTIEKKRKLVESVTKAVCESVDLPESAVSIVIEEMEKENFAQAGILRSDK